MTPLLSDRDLLARLVAFDTVSHRPNVPLVQWLADYLDRPGVRVTVQPGTEEGKANFVVEMGPEPDEMPAPADRPGLTLSGHLDVVPADEPGWTSDPFRLDERDGTFVGRGVCDMKGFCALAVNRLARQEPSALTRPLALLFTFDEEVGCLGARHFVEHWPRERALPRSVLVGEPTSLRAARMHKGHLRFRVVIHGRTAHTGTPELGVNAVEPAGHILVALSDLRRELELEGSPHGAHFESAPHAVLAVTGIRGGRAHNVVPDRAEIDVGLRPMPGMDTGDLARRVGEAVVRGVRKASAGRTVEADQPTFEVELLSESPPMLTPDDAPLYRDLVGGVGRDPGPGAPYATDGGWLTESGYQCVVFGPGAMAAAHRPDEHLAVDEFHEAGRILDALIQLRCAADGEEG